MADFRKISVFAALALLIVMAGTASAQTPLSCNANAAVPPQLRAEGFTELVGDIVITCTGGIPTLTTANVPQANVVVYLTTAITSRLYSNSVSEAVLLVDEPGASNNPAQPQYCPNYNSNGCTFAGLSTVVGTPGLNSLATNPVQTPYCSTNCAAYIPGFVYGGNTPSISRPNAYAGVLTNGNQLTFFGVPVDAPGTQGTRILRITNVRANANGVASGPSGTPGTIQALIAATPSSVLPVTQTTLVVGYVQPGLTFVVRNNGNGGSAGAGDIAFPQCNSLSRTATNNSFVLRFSENFPTAFKIQTVPGFQNVPGSVYNSESGFTAAFTVAPNPNPASTNAVLGTNIGLADSATRLKAVFANIPTGISLWVSLAQGGGSSATSTAVLKSGEAGNAVNAVASNTDFKCGFTTGCVTSGAAVSLATGAGSAVWEITAANQYANETLDFLAWFAYTANPGQNSPALGTGTVTGGFAPTPSGLGVSATTAAAASSSLWIPRFAEPTQSKNVVTIFVCRTNLLFPFVTNTNGFDTGIAISNTSTDPFGTTPQAGTITVYPYGDNQPASFSLGSLASGKTTTFLASGQLPNFQGYVIAQCLFQYAHGFAFVSDFGARNLAMGYLALVIPEPAFGNSGRLAQDLSKSSNGAGEQLGQ